MLTHELHQCDRRFPLLLLLSPDFPPPDGRLEDAVRDLLSSAEAEAKERRKQKGASLWNSKIQATQTESALAVSTL